jgi:hypothetical protein
MTDYGPLLLAWRKPAQERRRLKIGIAFNGISSPAWIRDVIGYLSGVPLFEVTPVPVKPVIESREPQGPPWLVDRLYSRSRRFFDPFRETGLGVTQDVPQRRFDMLVWLAPNVVPPEPPDRLARFGLFSVQLGEARTYPPYWREIVENEPTSATTVYWHTTSFGQGRPVRIARTSTLHDWAFTNNAGEPIAAIGRILASIGIDLLCDSVAWQERARAIPEFDRPHETRRYPSNWDAARFAARQALRSVRVRVQGRAGRVPRWFTAVRRRPSLFYSRRGIFTSSGFEEIPLAGTYMTDPFVVTEHEKNWMFFEDIPTRSVRGRLCCMELGNTRGCFGKPEVILESRKHLSFPCVFPHGNDYFMVPEESEDRVVQLYRATRFPYEFRLETTYATDIGLVDTVPIFLDGRWYFFTTTSGAEPFVETHLFWSDSLDGRWNLHPSSPVSSSVRNIRSAGHLFYSSGRLLRPTQDCSRRYGYGITINEILRLTPSEFEERRVDFIGPNWRFGLLGTHTLNSTHAIEVIDGIRYQ